MLKEQISSQKKGNAGMAVAIAYFALKGNTVCVPLTDTQPYDLVVDIDNELKRIQVKTTCYQRKNSYIVELRQISIRKTTATKIKQFNNKASDYLFVLTDNGDKFLIPSSIIKTTQIRLSNSIWQSYRIE